MESFSARFSSHREESYIKESKNVNNEAKQLITQWLNGRIIENITEDNSDPSIKLTPALSKADSKPITLQLLKDYEKKLKRNPFSNFSSLNETKTKENCENVDDIIERLKRKPIPGVTSNFVNRLARDELGCQNPIHNMEHRHKMVARARENREEMMRRRQEALKQKKEEQKILEKQKALKEKRILQQQQIEEEVICREMKKLKKKLENDRRSFREQNKTFDLKDERTYTPKKLSPEVKLAEIKETNDIYKIVGSGSTVNYSTHMVDSQVFLMRKKHEYKILKLFFTNWYRFVLSKRVLAGRAQALSDWKILQKSWIVWRKLVLDVNTKRQREKSQYEMNGMMRKMNIAGDKHKIMLLKKYFSIWQRFVKMQSYFSDAEQKKNETKAKMKAFLHAVANKNDCVEEKLSNASKSNGQLDISWSNPSGNLQSTPIKEMSRSNIRHKTSQKFSLSEYQKQKAILLKQTSIIAQQNKMINDLKNKSDAVNSGEQKKTSFNETFQRKNDSKKSFNVPERPKWVKNMESRAVIRQQKHLELQEKRKEKEREKLAEIVKVKEEEKERELIEKRQKIQKMKEERRLKMEKEQRKKEYVQWLKKMNAKADHHYSLWLIKYKGLKPWLEMIQTRKRQNEIAIKFYNHKLLSSISHSWHIYVHKIMKYKNNKADRLNHHLLIKQMFRQWTMYGERMLILEKKAAIHYLHVLRVKYFKRLESFALDERLRLIDQEEIAFKHNKRRLLKCGLSSFKKNLIFKQKEKDRRERLQAIHLKVLNVLPDFQPDISTTSCELKDFSDVEV